MALDISNISFEGNSNASTNANASTNQNDNQDVSHLDGNGGDNHNLDTKDSQTPDNQQGNAEQNNNKDGGQGTTGFHDATKDNGNQGGNGGDKDGSTQSSSTGGLDAGTQLDIDGKPYTVDDKGNIVDDKGNVFKQASEVNDWLKTVQTSNGDEEPDDKEITVASIQKALGVEITDENGNPTEFTNDAAGVKSYVEDVINLKSAELQQAAVNKLFNDNPLLKQFADYLVVNNGNPYGFGQLPDRSTIELDKTNETQQEAIIRMAAQEFGNKAVNDNYIQYLKQTGGLYDEAKVQLANLVEKDNNLRKQLETEAEQRRAQEEQEIDKYWNNVNNVINSGIVGGYKLPESFVKEVNGTKVTLNRKDFFNYLSKPAVTDEQGNTMTGYQRDLANLSDEDALAKEMLDAWLMFTGGTYKDLINMAVKEDNVRKLKIMSEKQRNAKSIKIVTKRSGKTDINDIMLS
jgi:hypothetical protein